MSRPRLAGLSLLVLPAPALAIEVAGAGVQITDDLEVRYHHVPEKLEHFEDRNILDYIEQVNRLNALYAKDRWSVGLQIDEVSLWMNRYILDDELYRDVDLLSNDLPWPADDVFVRLEKVYAQRRGQKLEWTLGDSYTSFGRGIALNIVRNTDIDVDTSIRGARAVIRGGQTDITLTTGLSNRQQVSQDNRNLDIEPDTPHMVSGARVERFGRVNAGAHAVAYAFRRSWAEEDGYFERSGLVRYTGAPDAIVAGATLDVPGLAGVDWFIEGDVFQYRAEDLAGGTDPLLGYAAYASASAYPGPVVLLVELKRTKDTERLNTFTTSEGWEVANVPTLEYEIVITEDSSAAVNSNDLWGARARADLAIRPGELTGFVSVAGFRDEELGGLHFNASPETIAHPIAGLQWLGGERSLVFNLGLRRDQRDDAAEGHDQMLHLDADVHIPIHGDHGLEYAGNVKSFHWGNNPQQQQDFIELSNALSWHKGEQLTLTIFQDLTDNPLINSEGNISEHVYGAGELQWKPSSSLAIKVFYGAYKAGIRCAGGQCRSLPGFEGGRLSLAGTF